MNNTVSYTVNFTTNSRKYMLFQTNYFGRWYHSLHDKHCIVNKYILLFLFI